MSQIVSLHINSDQPQKLVDFYQQVFNTEPEWSSEDGGGFMVNNFRLEILRHSEVSGKNNDAARLFFDILVEDVTAELDRMVGLGAEVVQVPYNFSTEDMELTIATLSDPDGNYFQLVSLG